MKCTGFGIGCVFRSLKRSWKSCDDVEKLQKIDVQEFEADQKKDKKNVLFFWEALKPGRKINL